MRIENLRSACLTAAAALAMSSALQGEPAHPRPVPESAFQQLGQMLPTPNDQRTASGAPGKGYWQQRADYVIDAQLDEKRHAINGRETITYRNESPDTLAYLWVQLDQNYYAADANSRLHAPAPDFEELEYPQLEQLLNQQDYKGDMAVSAVTDASGAPLRHMVNNTVMRVDLPKPLGPGEAYSFSIAWSFPISSNKTHNGRTGYELVGKDGNAIYSIAQWFPRMAAYTDASGWQIKQFLGQGEYTLDFGDYLVRLDVPADHVVGATGVLQNPEETLSPAQRARLRKAETSPEPVFIVTLDEAKRAERSKSSARKTWVYQAQNVRDFAFASSRKFVWDAMGVPGQTWKPDGQTGEGRPVMAMSFYPNEGGPLWPRYSTHAVAHALDVYSRYTFPYPYPVAISVGAALEGGMEYPMICFNGPRNEDGTYTEDEKFGFISLIIHEVGHNYFPMIVNSDERQWTWMDEGLNVLLEYLSDLEWQKGFALGDDTIDFTSVREDMKRGGWPIMTASDDYPAAQFVMPSYLKTAAALVALRETVLGRERFDFAFKTYAQRWMFKRPYPADFFRTMEDASGVDLDWYWRGWFYGVDYVDLALKGVREYQLDTQDPAIENAREKQEKEKAVGPLTERRDAAQPKYVDRHPQLKDFYDRYDTATVLPSQREEYADLLALLKEERIDPALLRTDQHFYAIEIENVGGLVMPVFLRVAYTDGSKEDMHVPAQIWHGDRERVTKLLITKKTLQSVELDADDGIFDADVDNNAWPSRLGHERFELEPPQKKLNPMRELHEKGGGGG